PGISFGVWTSPMMISVGYIIGPLFLSVWFLGALIGDFGLVFAATHLGLWDLAAAADIKTGLGIGVMVGTGAGIIIKSILPQAKEIFSPMFRKSTQDQTMISMRWAPWFLIILAFLFTFIADLSPWASILIILGAWLTTSMSCLIVGQSGINPMEIFGVIVLLLVKLIGETGVVPLFFTAAVIAVACGLTGDVMNDFKSGHLLKTNPKNQLIAEAIGGLIGAVVSVGVLLLFVKAYGTTAFGAGGMFVAPQASMVAAMVGGIANMPAFFIGLGIGLLLYLVNFPVMTLGLGIYLPFYLSLTAFLGGVIKFVLDKCRKKEDRGDGLVIASGLLGGEAVIGVVIAIIQVCKGLGGI
ncbi:MAG: OPT/YSL family transporter, partial [Clostridiales bacterium]